MTAKTVHGAFVFFRTSSAFVIMSNCFVIQPFDDTFNQRYSDIFEPAIRKAGLEPYRVDKDPSAVIPIESIHEGIKSAVVCLADITTNNPNVWYELGYALALTKQVVLICSTTERKDPYPFDIRHRAIINYTNRSTKDFDVLGKDITEKLAALLKSQDGIQSLRESPITMEVSGLTTYEIAVLAATANTCLLNDFAMLRQVISSMDQMGYTQAAFNLGALKLVKKGFIELKEYKEQGDYGDLIREIRITHGGMKWIEENESNFTFKVEKDHDSPF